MNKNAGGVAAVLVTENIVTKSTILHAAAWKRAFDEFLRKLGAPPPLFDLGADYVGFVDGRSYDQAIRAFLTAREIELPDRAPPEQPSAWSVASLADRKDHYLQEQVRRFGVTATPNAAALLHQLRRRGIATAAVCTDHNGTAMLRAAGADELFDIIVDGMSPFEVSGELSPDLFAEAARRLDLPPEQCSVVGDTPVGVMTCRRDGFGIIIGLENFGPSRGLHGYGADIVVTDLDEVHSADLERLPKPRLPGDPILSVCASEPPT